MIKTIGEVGKGVEGPTSYEIYKKYSDMEVEDIKAYVSTFERICDEYSCTLMCVGWTDIEEVFEEEHPLHAWVNVTTSVEPEFDPHDRAWAESELDDVPLLPEFATPPAPKRQKKTVGGRVRSKKYGISIADLETIEEDNDDETPKPSDNLVYQTSNDSTSKTNTPSEGSDHGGDISSVPPPAQPPDPIVFTGEKDFTHATQDQHHRSRQGREAQTSSQHYARKGKKVASQFQGKGQGQGRQASEDSGFNPNFISHRRNWLMKKKKMQEEWERQEKLRMEFETMEQASDTSSYASTEGYYQGQRGYLAYPQYPDASYYTGGGGAPLAPFSSARLGQARPRSAELGSRSTGPIGLGSVDPRPIPEFLNLEHNNKTTASHMMRNVGKRRGEEGEKLGVRWNKEGEEEEEGRRQGFQRRFSFTFC
ncbi:hypothetical protein Taro_040072 [Colocasia esculenta]|uniref:Uncharacterized protein n=1 Tax=Colocasia esculenta TaxID=4460 RepID=A0A843WAX7_COLES|nr:hypothetical protein [Colocasia esculenta]